MSTATATESSAPQHRSEPDANSKNSLNYQPNNDFDPDSFRMTVGEHLEELRTRLILALGGLMISVLACLLFAQRVVVFFCAPLTNQFIKHNIPPQVYYSDLTDPFMTYLKITMICAGAIAGPWMIYQIWLFIAAGLYPNERKAVTKYIPLSIGLFVTGVVFVYVIVLPLCISFFIEFSSHLSPNPLGVLSANKIDTPIPYQIPIVPGDVKIPHPGDMWIDPVHQSLKIVVPAADNPGKLVIRRVPFSPDSMMAPIITLGDYIGLVLTFMLTFGVAFQLPLVMLALVTLGVVDIEFLKTKRKVVFFGMTVAAAFLAPGDIVTSMLALLIPLVILYELGLILVRFTEKRKLAEQEGPKQ